MTSSSDKGGKKGPDEPASDARGSEGLDDLMTNPAAVMAAATAFGFGVAAQMSKLFLGSIQGAMEVTGQIARQLEDERKAAEAEKPAEAKAEAPAQTAEPAPVAAKAKPEKPAAAKVKAKAAEPAKAAPVKADKPAPAPKAKAAPKAKSAAEPAEPPQVKAAAKPKAAPKAKAVPKAKEEIAAAAAKPKKASSKADDLKRIDGVGPKVEQVLKGRGITRFQDLAEMDEKALVALDKELALDGRALRDDWACQARRLAGSKLRSRK
ncbi:5' DNA nuclease [Rhizobium rosettiformans]|uniref:5' DNA nuclease n=1 Tax=Rhizobium rosettiformans TaxID=1368430 RepID=UPI002862D50B|nr:5' DNA nuclease [Rhizobium rosettiformans]MDR7027155.1 NADH-quinone oxidoreductase subunit E [Rhizobium rosettiformans]MDR7065276.1 NADH-quinone oxidoreductase subunit E [Rhizobium rosettiformans]